MRDHRSLERYLDGRFVAQGYARRVMVDYDICHDSTRICVELIDGRRLGYRLTGHEIAMDGELGFQYWLRRIDDDVRRFAHESDNQWRNANTNSVSYLEYGPTIFGIDFTAGHDPKAIQKAKDLFKLACGSKAFDMLNAGNPLPITGSKGTKYTLHNRSTYCVERMKDGAKLCAVVPNVPLFDHLLGIKLMVEHDEPRFLKTANVSGGRA